MADTPSYPYLGPTGWFTQDQYNMYQLGCLKEQPDIEPGSALYDPNTAPDVLDDMATSPTPFPQRWGTYSARAPVKAKAKAKYRKFKKFK
jgi:hypothetical protein